MTLNARSSRRVVVNTGNVPQIEMLTTAEQAIYVKVYAGDPLTGDLQLMSIGSDYSLSGIGPSTSSFIVNILNPLAWDAETYPRFAVFVDYPVDQPSDVGLGGIFGARFEAALDRIVLNMQSMDDRIKRSLSMPVTRTVDEVYAVTPTPGTVVGFDEDGNVTPMDPTDFLNSAGFASAAQGQLADTAVQPQSVPAYILMWLASLPNRPDGDTTGLAVGQWYVNGGTLSQVQP